jgi:serine/threonine protein kinase
MGTPLFMSPEQARSRTITDRTDIYAMGAVAWGMLTGKALFGGGNAFDVLTRHLRDQPPALAPLVPGVPPQLEALVLRMLSKDPLKRPSATEVRRELAALRPATTSQVAVVRDAPKRSPLRFALVGLGVGVAGAAVWLGLELETARAQQEVAAKKPIPATTIPHRGPPEKLMPVVEAAAEPVALDAGPEQIAEAPPQPSADPKPTTWRCEKIRDIGQPLQTYTNGHWFFSLQLQDEPAWLIASAGERNLAIIKKTQKALASCKATNGQFLVSRFGNHGTWGTGAGQLFGPGPLVDLNDLAIEKSR